MGILAPPGTYTLTLTVEGTHYSRTVTVSNDPRSAATAADLREQQALQLKIAAAIRVSYLAFQQVDGMRLKVDSIAPKDSTAPLAKVIKGWMAQMDSIGGTASDERDFPFPNGRKPESDLFSLQGRFVDQLQAQEFGDMAPTEPALLEFASGCRDLTIGIARWRSLNAAPLAALNAELERAGVKAIAPAQGVAPPDC